MGFSGLPQTHAAVEFIMEGTNPAPASAGQGGLGLRILLVEDHADTLAMLTQVLRRLDCEVSPANTVRAATTAAGQQRFDLVVSDLGLPDGSGLDLMRELRDLYGLTGVALTGYDAAEDIAKARAAGFVAHLTKPVNLKDLEAVLRRAKP